MFCKHCGKQIPDGSICDCQMQGGAQPQQYQQQPSYSNQPQQYQQQPNYGGQQGYGSSQGSFNPGDILSAFVDGIKHPVSALRRAYDAPSGMASYILGGIHLIIVFILPIIVLNVLVGGMARSYGYSGSTGINTGSSTLYFVLYAVVSRLMTAAFALLAGDSGTQFTKTLAASCQATVQFMLYNLIAGIFGLLGPFALFISMAILAVKSVGALVLDYETIKINTQNKDKAFVLFVINEVVVFVIMLILSLIIGANMANNLRYAFR